MLSIGVLFFAIGFILILFNTVTLSFVKDQEKDKRQVIAGVAFTGVSLVLLFVSIRNIMQGE